MIQIVHILSVLDGAGYSGVEENNPAIYKCKSPHTGRPIVIPMGASDVLSVRAIRYLLQYEPDGDRLVDLMLLR